MITAVPSGSKRPLCARTPPPKWHSRSALADGIYVLVQILPTLGASSAPEAARQLEDLRTYALHEVLNILCLVMEAELVTEQNEAPSAGGEEEVEGDAGMLWCHCFFLSFFLSSFVLLTLSHTHTLTHSLPQMLHRTPPGCGTFPHSSFRSRPN